MVLVSIRGGAHTRVESHFERLVSKEIYEHMQAKEGLQQEARPFTEDMDSEFADLIGTTQSESTCPAGDLSWMTPSACTCAAGDGNSFGMKDGAEGNEEEGEKNCLQCPEGRTNRNQVNMLDEFAASNLGGHKHAQWLSMFGVRTQPDRTRKTEQDLMLAAAKTVADSFLRDHVTMPAKCEDGRISMTDADSGGRLPPVSCGFQCCTFTVSGRKSCRSMYEDDGEHPWDQELRTHVLEVHGADIRRAMLGKVTPYFTRFPEWDVYKEALSVKERGTIPIIGPSVDRRACEYTSHVYNDDCVQALICFACARVKVCTGRLGSDILVKSGEWLFSLPPGSLQKNFSMTEYTQRYRQPGTPLAFRPHGPDFSDWELQLHPSVSGESLQKNKLRKTTAAKDLERLSKTTLLCCPEDHVCENGCKENKYLCEQCRIPICQECQLHLQTNTVIPHGLMNDNFQGYAQAWIYEMGVTWMEKTVSSPFWTGLTLFSIGQRGDEGDSRRHHLMHDAMYSAGRRVAFKGQVFSAPLDWYSLQDQLAQIEKAEARISLPHVGEALMSRVRLSITSGLVELNKHMKQATVRRDVVVQLIKMHKDAGHPDYKCVDMEEVKRRAEELTPSKDAAIPIGLLDVLEMDEDEA